MPLHEDRLNYWSKMSPFGFMYSGVFAVTRGASTSRMNACVVSPGRDSCNLWWRVEGGVDRTRGEHMEEPEMNTPVEDLDPIPDVSARDWRYSGKRPEL